MCDHRGLSRRSLLAGSTVLGLSALTGPAWGARSAGASHLTLRYRPTQPTGWPGTPGASFSETLGGHTVAKDFTFNDKPYRISLLPSDGTGQNFDPLYENTPADPEVNFKATLATAFGAHYSFQYQGGFAGHSEFEVQSYSVFAQGPSETSPGTSFGGGLYVVYRPDRRRGDPAADENLRWIQVVNLVSPAVPPDSVVDNFGRANPFYLYGGLTSVNGAEVFNFHDIPQGMAEGNLTLADRFVAETFLAQDTGRKDATGRAIINLLGGLRYGWKVAKR
ncbi:hypothetical protein ACWF0M_05155 [Kribbella sp. NPDC055110]